MKLINNLFIQMLQVILPLYLLSFIINTINYISKKIFFYYKNIKIKCINENLTIYNYNKNNKTIIIINGGGLIFEDITDITIMNNILPKLNNYNIIVIKYSLLNKLSETIKEINETFKLLLTYNFNIKVFIGNSIGCTILFELFKIYKQFINEKLILISPVVNIDIKYNNNFKKDLINYNFYNYIKKKLYDINVIIDYSILPNTFIICSNNEVFYDDIIDFHNKFKKSKLYCVKNGYHSEYIVYGFFNFYETNNITNKIINFIEN